MLQHNVTFDHASPDSTHVSQWQLPGKPFPKLFTGLDLDPLAITVKEFDGSGIANHLSSCDFPRSGSRTVQLPNSY